MDVPEETVAINVCSAGPDEPAPRDSPPLGTAGCNHQKETTLGDQETW